MPHNLSVTESSRLASVFYPYARDMQLFTDADEAVKRIQEIYDESAVCIQRSFERAVEKNNEESHEGLEEAIRQETYPYVGVYVPPELSKADSRLSYGVVSEPGVYGATLTRPDIFEDYYREQIALLIKNHNVPVMVGVSDWSIPLPFVIDHMPTQLGPEQLRQIQSGFVLPNLSRIDDSIANCVLDTTHTKVKPLSLFSAERVDYSLHRLHHYTATRPEHFQRFIILTNYQRYVEAFIEFGKEQLAQKDSPYQSLVGPGNVEITYQDGQLKTTGTELHHLPQMPSYHLTCPDRQGITFINIGVGPSNAKNITDHLAVLRPHCWLMVGHCAGLRSTQSLGDYVLAHGYVRDDHVLDDDLPIWIPVPAIAEVQLALQDAVQHVLKDQPTEVKAHMRTGTVVTTDDRNWELKTKDLYKKFRQSRAIALDMECATIAANGFRFRVPYGTLLCVSDKPIHGELKLRGMANKFYQERVLQHLQVGLETIRLLRERNIDQLHSRKLRGFDEPPFR